MVVFGFMSPVSYDVGGHGRWAGYTLLGSRIFQGKKILPREAKSVLDSSLPMHFHYCIQVMLKKNSKGKAAKPWVFVISAAK